MVYLKLPNLPHSFTARRHISAIGLQVLGKHPTTGKTSLTIGGLVTTPRNRSHHNSLHWAGFPATDLLSFFGTSTVTMADAWEMVHSTRASTSPTTYGSARVKGKGREILLTSTEMEASGDTLHQDDHLDMANPFTVKPGLPSLPKLNTNTQERMANIAAGPQTGLSSNEDFSTISSRASGSTNTWGRPPTASSYTSFGSAKSPLDGFHSLGIKPTISGGVVPETKYRAPRQPLPTMFTQQVPMLSPEPSASHEQSFGPIGSIRARPPTAVRVQHGSGDLKLEYPGPPRIKIHHLSESTSFASLGRTIRPSFRDEAAPSEYYTQPTMDGSSLSRTGRRTSASRLLSPLSFLRSGHGKNSASPNPSSSATNARHERQHTPLYSLDAPTRVSLAPSDLTSPSPPLQPSHSPSFVGAYPNNQPNDASSIHLTPVEQARSVLSTAESHYTLLEAAIATPDLSVFTTQDGEVVGGTFEGFVERFIDNFNLRRDEGFREVFLTGCIDLVTPESFFTVLASRFREISLAGPTSDFRERNGVQTIIFKVMLSWLESRRMPITLKVLLQMERFCQESLRFETLPDVISRGNDLLQLIQERIKEHKYKDEMLSFGEGFPCCYYPKHVIVKPETPTELAVALTIFEGEKYKAIMPGDYLAYLRTDHMDGYHNPVETARVVNNHLIQWVKQSILHHQDILQRASTLKFFVHTAQECRKLGNFSSMVAIALALGSEPVARLKLTKRQLSGKLASWLDEIVAMVDDSNNHAAYRSMLLEVRNTRYQLSVPWLALHLREIQSILGDHEHGQVIMIDNRPFIDFKRYYEYLRVFREHLTFDIPAFEKQRVPGHLAYLEQRLADVTVDDAAEAELMNRSLKYEEGETKMIKNRTLELHTLGFGRPRKRHPTAAGARPQAN